MGSRAAISEERAGEWGVNTEWELSAWRGPSEGVGTGSVWEQC